MPNAAGEGHHRVEGVDDNAGGIHGEAKGDPEARDAGNDESPDEGPTMTGAGAQPSGNAMDHWATASPNTDATKPDTMPNTKSTPLPGETEDRTPV